MTAAATYPKHWEADVVLRDGSTMRIRPIDPSDAQALQQFHMAQSEQSQYFRFFAPINRLSDSDLRRFTRVDHSDRVALVMVDGPEILAVGRYDRLVGDERFPDDDVAEVAFNVSDKVQGRGLGSILLEHLAAAGRESGIRKFVADVLPANTRMLRVFSDAGYDVEQRFDDGVVSVQFTIRPTDKAMKVLAERERRAEALSMQRVMAASSVVVYGAGEEGGALASLMWQRVKESDFTGTKLYAQTPSQLQSMLNDVGAPLDLAVVAAPPKEVLEVIPILGNAGTGAVLVPTGGFALRAEEDGVPQARLLRRIRAHGMRLVGPRSYGVIAQGDHGPLPALLAPVTPHLSVEGVGLFCQSSQAARAMFGWAYDKNLPVSSAIVAGHRADVSGNDTMQFWAQDANTKVVCVHLESIGNPRKFSRVARHLAQQRPLIATVAGRSGQVLPPGHHVGHTHTPRKALEELMDQAGVLRAGSLHQQLDWACAFITQPLPRGDKVAVLTNSGTHQAVLHEIVQSTGGEVVEELAALNPVAGPKEYFNSLEELANRDDWDAAIITYGPYIANHADAVSRHIAEFAHKTQKTVLAQVHGKEGLDKVLQHETTQVPSFRTGEDAVGVLEAMRTYRTRSTRPSSPQVDPPGIDRRGADAIIAREIEELKPGQRKKLPESLSRELLACYGLRVVPSRTATTPDEAIEAAETVGWPIALKTVDDVLRHRSDLGGVRLDLGSPTQLRDAWKVMSHRLANLGRSGEAAFEVQAMAPTGVACVLVAEEDPLYGPIISFGLAGDAIELLDDIAYRVPPLSETDVEDLIHSIKAAPRLYGHRNLPAMHVEGLVDVISRLSVMKAEIAPILKVDLNPVVVSETAVAIVSAQVWVSQPQRGDIARRVLPE